MDDRADFFVSFAKQDIEWARWIAAELQTEGHRVVFQEQDMLPGQNVVRQMQLGAAATRTIAVLSPDYLKRPYPMSEWAAAYVKDPVGVSRKLIPAMVRRCSPPGLLAPIVFIDLVGVDEEEARRLLLAGVSQRRPKLAKPPFPGGA